ncbi:Ribonucleoside-diphosphate reductase large subunit [Mucor velutinosus]|uniref:Ribonucleoside-diphosphate reductase large subunit n=1 Tax=Mucor velutinosus TaxID=708070 RepID=A0AAN7DMZ4_9FUNG|nr:Ribonucleoside-diphosphate reductase large subunit [Mucor velutinosus]
MGILSVKSSQTYEDMGDTNNIHASMDTLMSLGSRVVLIASKDSAAKALFIAAISGHVNNETAWLIMGNSANVIRQLNQHVDVYNHIVQTRLDNANQSSTSTTYQNAVEQLAWTTNKLDRLTMEHLFAGGVFIFEQQTDLTGYPPYDAFQQKLSQFDPSAATSSTYQSGLAYSCMMVMAYGFGQLVRDSIDSNYTLQELTSGQLMPRYSLSIFNDTGFATGPQGPVLFDKNGDVKTGNFKIFNLHHGSQVTETGHVLGGIFHLSTDPIYFDGTKKVLSTKDERGSLDSHIVYQPPSGTPPFTVIKAGITAPISIVAASTAMVGVAMTLIALIMVINFRHHPVFKSSRVYKTVNNVYNNSNYSSSNNQLLKISCFILAFNTVILACWLVLFGNVKLSAIPVSSTVVVNTCSYDGSGHTFFVALLTIQAGIQLCLSVYLALKTKSFGGYSKYSEHKQLGLSVYNIFFSALIGFIIFFMPTTDFYTRYYLTAMTILWASTFSLCVLFFPKIFKVLFPKKALVLPTTEKRDGHDEKTLYDEKQLLTMNRMTATSTHILVDEDKKNDPVKWNGSMPSAMMDTYQEKLPVQYVFRYFPFLARWQMRCITLLPQVSFLSIQPGNQNAFKKPILFCYSHAFTISNVPGNYVFKVHGAIGSGHCDLLIQVSDQKQLSRWLGLFDRKLARHDRNERSSRPLSLSVDKTHCGSSITDDMSDNSSKRSILDGKASQFTICSDDTSASSVTQAHCKQDERNRI